VYGMRLHLDDELASEGEDPLQAIRRIERWQREKEVDKVVAMGEHAVYEPTIEAVPHALLAGPEREVSPHQSSAR